MTHLAICLPCYEGKVDLNWMRCYVSTHDLLTHEGIKVDLVSISGCGLITAARSELVTAAMDSGAEQFLFVDGKQVWEPASILRLLLDLDEVDAVADPVASRTGAFMANYTGETKGFLKKVSHSAIAILGLNRRVLEQLLADYEHMTYKCRNVEGKTHVALFEPELENMSYIGEDIAFSRRIIKAGFGLWVDEALMVRRLS